MQNFLMQLMLLLFTVTVSNFDLSAQPITVGGAADLVVTFDAPATDFVGSNWDGSGWENNDPTPNGFLDSHSARAQMNVGSSTDAVAYGNDLLTGRLAGGEDDATDPSVGMYCSDRDDTAGEDICKRIKPAEGAYSPSGYTKAAAEAIFEFRVEYDDDGGTVTDPQIVLEVESSFHCDNVSTTKPLTVTWEYKVNSGSWVELDAYTENLVGGGASVDDWEDWNMLAASTPSPAMSDGDIVSIRARIEGENTGTSSSPRNPTVNSYYICNIDLRIEDEAPLPVETLEWKSPISICHYADVGSTDQYRMNYEFDVTGQVDVDYYKILTYDENLIGQWCVSYDGSNTEIDATTNLTESYSGTAIWNALNQETVDQTYLLQIRSVDINGFTEMHTLVAEDYTANTTCTSLNGGNGIFKEVETIDMTISSNSNQIYINFTEEVDGIISLIDANGVQKWRGSITGDNLSIPMNRTNSSYAIAFYSKATKQFSSKLIIH